MQYIKVHFYEISIGQIKYWYNNDLSRPSFSLKTITNALNIKTIVNKIGTVIMKHPLYKGRDRYKC